MRIVFVDQQAWLWNTSGLARYLATRPDIEFYYIADLIEFGHVWETPDVYPNTVFIDFPEWHNGDIQSNNGYQGQCIEWKHIERKYWEHCKKAPDLILIQETAFSPWGDKSIFDGVPCGFICEDAPRGIDHPLRIYKAAGCTDMFVPSKWWASVCSMTTHRYEDDEPMGRCGQAPNSGFYIPPEHVHVVPVCADPFWFHEPKEPVCIPEHRLKIMWGGNDCLTDADGEHVPVGYGEYLDSDVEIVTEIGQPARFSNSYGEYLQRSKMVWYSFKDSEMPFHILYPPRHGGEYARIMQMSDIVWNCQGGWNAYHYAESYRIWQAAACGACLVTNDTDCIRDSFEVGKEVEVYKFYSHPEHHLFEWFDWQEMKNLCMELLADEERRIAIGKAAARKTRECHLPVHRFHAILASMGFEAI